MLASARNPLRAPAVLRGRGRGNAEVLASPRSPLRRLADCWGLTPGIGPPCETVGLAARDGVRLAASYLPGPRAGGPAVLIAPGFAGHRTKPAYALLAERLAERVGVLALDLRGHGGSGGRCTFGVREVLDVAAGADWLRVRGHGWVGAIGASMGGAAVLRAAGLGRTGRLDAVCAISAPARWGQPAGAGDPGPRTGAGDPGRDAVDAAMHDDAVDAARRDALDPSGQDLVDVAAHHAVDSPGVPQTPAMRGISRTVTVGWYRALVGGLLHVRIAPNPWSAPAVPLAPLDLVGAIAPVPLLVVHGADDHYFPPSQAELLYAAAAEPRALWLEPVGFGHAEDGLRSPFVDDLARAVLSCATTGSWPTHR